MWDDRLWRGKDSAQSLYILWQLTVWESLCVCVNLCRVRWVKMDQTALWFQRQNETHFISMLLQSPNSLLLQKHPTHKQSNGCGQNIGNGWAALVCFVVLWWKTNRLSSSGGRPPDQSRMTKHGQLLQLVCACLDHLGIWPCYTQQ